MNQDERKRLNALVPMKGHSERVTSKNIRDFCGKPLFTRIIDTLLNSKYIAQIYINTDSEMIKELTAIHYGGSINIIDRPKELWGDYVSMNEIIRYDLTVISGEYFLQTHATNPLLKTSTVDDAIETYFDNINKGFDSLFSVTRLQSRLYYKDGSPINHNPLELIRTQDLPPVYEENSNIYIFSRKGFSLRNMRIGMNPFMYEIDKLEAVDIDEDADFKLAECLFKYIFKSE